MAEDKMTPKEKLAETLERFRNSDGFAECFDEDCIDDLHTLAWAYEKLEPKAATAEGVVAENKRLKQALEYLTRVVRYVMPPLGIYADEAEKIAAANRLGEGENETI